jgi:CarD family transcriptional regulator
MVFEVGETVVYPHHGAAKIEEIKMRTVKGEEKMYLKLKVAQGDLTIEVPAENVDLVDLWRRDHDRGLSAGEKRMLAKARQILISELALAEKTDEEKAASVLDEVLAS